MSIEGLNSEPILVVDNLSPAEFPSPSAGGRLATTQVTAYLRGAAYSGPPSIQYVGHPRDGRQTLSESRIHGRPCLGKQVLAEVLPVTRLSLRVTPKASPARPAYDGDLVVGYAQWPARAAPNSHPEARLRGAPPPVTVGSEA